MKKKKNDKCFKVPVHPYNVDFSSVFTLLPDQDSNQMTDTVSSVTWTGSIPFLITTAYDENGLH